MSNFDLVEKLRSRANVSYEEARAALDACNDDLLDALIYLEKQGKVSAPSGGGAYSSKAEPQREEASYKTLPPKHEHGEDFRQLMNRFFRWCGDVINKGNKNYFEVWRHNQKILSVPVTVLVLLLIFAFWITLPLLVVGLFLSCRYTFHGTEVESINMNGIMDSAADAAEGLKTEVINAHQNYQNKNGGKDENK